MRYGFRPAVRSALFFGVLLAIIEWAGSILRDWLFICFMAAITSCFGQILSLSVGVSDIHQLSTNPGHPFAIGLTMAKLAAFTVDEKGNETFDTSGALTVHEMLSQMNPTLVMSEKNLQDENTKPAPMLISLVLQNYRGHVDHWVESYQVPVPALKEHIASVTAVLSEQQRLIYRGKVLKDDQLLSAYLLHGKVVHKVGVVSIGVGGLKLTEYLKEQLRLRDLHVSSLYTIRSLKEAVADCTERCYAAKMRTIILGSGQLCWLEALHVYQGYQKD
ncbi:unnamed protein product [Lactuca saligna]|uniref:Ubiquitin-like domain-containing protein n=1 Tax=Lactuca saligna TaxID=75948 RepID=A0AA35Y7S0_LACSI|nr:unnamed protein product [Lactuca saligna]